MDHFDIERLSKHKDTLKEVINFDALRPHLNDRQIFSNDMLNDIDSAGVLNADKNTELLRVLPKRGPHAYKNFINSLVDSGQMKVANLLCDAIPASAGMWDGDVITATALPSGTSVYRMEANPRGVALILSNTEFQNNILTPRIGGHYDEVNLKRLFELLNFEVDFHPNKSKNETLAILKEFQTDKRHLKADACVIAILSHGSMGGFYTWDGATIDNEQLLDMFNNLNCEYLHYKPKLFFLQHCRGDTIDMSIRPGKLVTDSSPSQMPNEIIGGVAGLPAWSDMKICYSTSPKHVSLRSEEHGTWFILTLVNVFSQRAHDTSLEDMLIMVGSKMLELEAMGWKQSPEIVTRGWRRKLFFNPGL